MRVEVLRQEGYQLLQDGVIELARVEANGIRVDNAKLQSTKKKLQKSVGRLREELETEPVWRLWRKRFGSKANLTSREQLSTILHQELGKDINSTTASGAASADEEALQDLAEEEPWLLKYIRLTKYEKALGTFLRGIEQEIVGERLHPVFNLHLVKTYRSSSDTPNFQNFPVRDKEVSEIIRSVFIPSQGCVIVENDFKGIEVNVAACYHKDKNFISYITTPGKDMHRDMAAQLYMLEPKQVDKEARYGAKNKFVFPEFYGDFYVSCARSMWEWIRKGKLKAPNGESLYAHLAAQGITKLGACDPANTPLNGTFEKHVKEVENDFWNRRFRDYGRWRKEWFRLYQERGYFDLFTGFRIHGFFNRNSVTNYPIQGSAFHCLLWSLIQINRELRSRKMRSRIVGQIHDSLIGDVRIEELSDYLAIVQRVTSQDLREHYKWIIVPMQIEYEMAPHDWFHKQEFQYRNGRLYHPAKPDVRLSANQLITELSKNQPNL